MIGKLGRRFAMMLGGEALQSGFNFVLNIALAGTLPAKDYGFFAIVMLIGGFGMIYMRALIGVPACIFIPQSRSARAARAYAVTFGSGALVLSFGATLVVTGVLALWRPDAALAGGAFVGAWSLRFYVRMLLFAQRRAALATIGDLAFTASATAFCLPLLLRPNAAAMLQQVLIALVFANGIGALLSLLLLRQPIRLSFRRSVRRRFKSLLPTMRGSIVSVTMANVQAQGPALALAAIAGPAAYAPIAATIAFFAPLRLFPLAIGNIVQPELAVAIQRSDRRALTQLLLFPTAVIAAVCFFYGAAMDLFFPILSQHLIGHRFASAPLPVIALEIWTVATIAVLYSVPRALLDMARQFRRTVLLSAAGAVAGIPTTIVVLHWASPAWALLGLLLSEAIVFLGCWLSAAFFVWGRFPDARTANAQPSASQHRPPPLSRRKIKISIRQG